MRERKTSLSSVLIWTAHTRLGQETDGERQVEERTNKKITLSVELSSAAKDVSSG